MSLAAELTTGQPLLVRLLLHRGSLDPKQMEVLREARSRDSSPLERILIKKGMVNEREIADAYAEHLALPLFLPTSDEVARNPALTRLLPEKLCRDQLI